MSRCGTDDARPKSIFSWSSKRSPPDKMLAKKFASKPKDLAICFWHFSRAGRVAIGQFDGMFTHFREFKEENQACDAVLHLPSNEEANCPRGCRCERVSVTCRDVGFKNPDVFQQLHQLAFPHLDTIIMTGNSFGDMREGLFPEGDEHTSVTLLNLTSNGITTIAKETFQQTPNVEFLYLNDNNILSTADVNPFGPLKKLRNLYMKKALGRRSPKSKSELLSVLFSADHTNEFTDLTLIDLSENDIGIIHPETFCKIKGLRRLELQDNKLTEFVVPKNCLGSLEALILSGNQIKTIPVTLWQSLPSLTSLDISKNPLQCDCQLEPFIKIATTENFDFLNQEKTACDSPPSLKGKPIFDIKNDLCRNPTSTFGTILLLLLIGGAVLFVYRHYRKRRPQPVNYYFGYAGLNNSECDDENVRPEFV
ncbi:hypothetical protein WR25_13176 [Diploscapter pachys]|uniref:LRRCT domain-containing protein n=1 Tax=Diploscapter pachys TaxID=2018661 RepID=A0A2A2LL16_9BILA|nr:hypothetical protein WR25_13176 [Diploscapter pachys]